MKVKVLVEGEVCDVVAVMDGENCPAEEFLTEGEAATAASREGLTALLSRVADLGLQTIPVSAMHEANKAEKIYEFRKGRLRLFFFKGEGRQVAVCTSGVMKKGQKADKAAVRKAAAWRSKYEQAVKDATLEVIDG